MPLPPVPHTPQDPDPNVRFAMWQERFRVAAWRMRQFPTGDAYHYLAGNLDGLEACARELGLNVFDAAPHCDPAWVEEWLFKHGTGPADLDPVTPDMWAALDRRGPPPTRDGDT